jgi:hypothetical protein
LSFRLISFVFWKFCTIKTFSPLRSLPKETFSSPSGNLVVLSLEKERLRFFAISFAIFSVPEQATIINDPPYNL